jgi:hypothetical protein
VAVSTGVEPPPVRRPWPVRVARALGVVGVCLLPVAVPLLAVSIVTRAIRSCDYLGHLGVAGSSTAILGLVELPIFSYLLAGALVILLARWTQWRLGRVAVVTLIACVSVAAVYVWLNVGGQYMPGLCPDGVPPWWPAWLPVYG